MATQNYEKLIPQLLNQMPDYVTEYYRSKASIPMADSTLYQYLHSIEDFFLWLIDSGVSDVESPKDISMVTLEKLKLADAEAYKLYLLDKPSNFHTNRKLSTKTARTSLMALRSLYEYLTELADPNDDGEPYFYRNVIKKIRITKVGETKSYSDRKIIQQLFVSGEDKRFLDFLENEYENDRDKMSTKRVAYYKRNKKRDLAIIALLFASGVRIAELVNLNIEDLNTKQHSITVTRKGGKLDMINYAAWIDRYIDDYLVERETVYQPGKEEHALFLSFYGDSVKRIDSSTTERTFKTYSTDFGRPSTPHKARHTLGTEIYQKTKDIQVVATQLGQTTTSATGLYVNLSDSDNQDVLNSITEEHEKQ